MWCPSCGKWYNNNKLCNDLFSAKSNHMLWFLYRSSERWTHWRREIYCMLVRFRWLIQWFVVLLIFYVHIWFIWRNSWIPWNLSFRYFYCTGQFTPKMKANAVSRLLSSLVWIDPYNECNGMTSFMEFMKKLFWT